jgi:hypothetical protein
VGKRSQSRTQDDEAVRVVRAFDDFQRELEFPTGPVDQFAGAGDNDMAGAPGAGWFRQPGADNRPCISVRLWEKSPNS